MTDRAIRSMLVAGGGMVAVSAAIALSRALPQVDVMLIETPLDPAALADRLPGSQPSIARFHALLGLDEAELIATGAATWRIGTRFRRWSARGADWYHVTGEHGPRLGTIDFHQLWARAVRSGNALPYHAYAAAGVLAHADKFVLPIDDPGSPLASYDYALRLVPDRYSTVLARHAEQRGVRRMRGSIAAIEHETHGAIRAVTLADGRRFAADLYVDCGGPAAPLRSAMDGDFVGWGEYLPTMRVSIGGSDEAPRATDDITRTPTGWSWHAPGAGRGTVLAPDPGGGPGTGTEIRPGCRPAPWRCNVIAIGDAAVGLDPLNWLGLHLAQRAIERLLELLPDRDFHPVELAEYNRRSAADACAARDLAAIFYHCPGGPGGGFRGDWLPRTLPHRLAATIEQFGRRGHLSPIDDDTIGRESRIAALIGLGYVPRRTEPLADALTPDFCAAAMARWVDGLASIVPQLPRYDEYLDNSRRDLQRG